MVALGAMIYYNAVLFGIFVALIGAGYAYFRLTRSARDAAPADDMLRAGAVVPD